MNCHQVIKHNILEINAPYAKEKHIESRFIGDIFKDYVLTNWRTDINFGGSKIGVKSIKKVTKNIPEQAKNQTLKIYIFFTQSCIDVLDYNENVCIPKSSIITIILIGLTPF